MTHLPERPAISPWEVAAGWLLLIGLGFFFGYLLGSSV